METTDFLVIESDPNRAESVISALQFLGYHPKHAKACGPAGDAAHVWRAVFVGTIADPAEAERQFALLGTAATTVPVLLSSDSEWGARLCAATSPFASRVGMIDFPLRYEQLAEVMRSLYARLLGGRRGDMRFVGESKPMALVNGLIRQVAPFDSSVLVLGESGTGKEMVARTSRQASP